MVTSSLLQLTLLAASASLATCQPTSRGTTDPSRFNWGPCEFEPAAEMPFKYECSNFTVPLDYSNSDSDDKLNIQLLRIPAVNGKSKGSIFFNFGGPGLEARKTLVSEGEILQTITEGKHDLVAWDPR